MRFSSKAVNTVRDRPGGMGSSTRNTMRPGARGAGRHPRSLREDNHLPPRGDGAARGRDHGAQGGRAADPP